jgi:hypothetical protein
MKRRNKRASCRRDKWIRVSKKRDRKRLARKRLKRERRTLEARSRITTSHGVYAIYAPQRFELLNEPHRTELLNFLTELRKATLVKDKRITIDFSNTRKMIAAGTLLFLAEVSRIVVARGGPASSGINYRYVHDAKVAQVLQQIGFFDTIGRVSNVRPRDEDVVHWRAVSGVGAEGEKANDLVQNVRQRLPSALSMPLYDGLVEAMTNCSQHAYTEPREDGTALLGNGEWWMFAKEQNDKLYVVLCDLGIGIPRSLPMTTSSDVISKILASAGRAAGLSHSDADLVQAAIEVGRSRTGLANRGKGFGDIIDVIDKASEGGIHVFSNAGYYSYALRSGSASRVVRNLKGTILGTLISWSVPVRQGFES